MTYPETFDECCRQAEEAHTMAAKMIKQRNHAAAVRQMKRYRLLIEHILKVWPDEYAALDG